MPSAFAMPSLPSFGGEPRIVALGAIGLFLLLFLGFSVWRTGARKAELEVRIGQEVTDSTRFASTIALVNTMRARQDTVQQKISIIRSVDERRYLWPHMMDEIGRAVPDFTWLTQITSTAATDSLTVGPMITLQGNAGSTQALTRLMKNLESSPFIRRVTLVTSEKVTEEGLSMQRFTFEANYEEPPAAVIQTVPIVIIN